MLDLAALGGPYETIYDVGGSNGDFAAAAIRQWPQATIYSFEPRVDAALRSAEAAQGRWTVLSYGLAEIGGERPLKRNLDSPEASTLLAPGPLRRELYGLQERYEEEPALFFTLDDVVPGFGCVSPALLKIDVEGAELLVLEGGRDTIAQFDTVVIECNFNRRIFTGAPTPGEVYRAMDALGFEPADPARAGELRGPERRSDLSNRDQRGLPSGELLQADLIWRRR